MKKRFCIVCSYLVVFLITGCSVGIENLSGWEDGKTVSIVNWNVQTFFDAEKDGCEYEEFQKAGNWNKEKYEVRLARLCGAITEMNADIYIMEEIENSAILYDVSNQLAGESWRQKSSWKYSCFAKPEGSAIGIGVISRYPLYNMNSHMMDIRIEKTPQPVTRYILEFTVEAKDGSFTVLANHWKSKSGGEEKTEIWRDWQESVLSARVSKLLAENQRVVCCGDFNRDVLDFCVAEGSNSVLLRNADFGSLSSAKVSSPWITSDGSFTTQTGSYYYDDSWERIDNFFTAGNIEIVFFEPKTNGSWAKADGTPFSYALHNAQGYSDHLPLLALLRLL